MNTIKWFAAFLCWTATFSIGGAMAESFLFKYADNFVPVAAGCTSFILLNDGASFILLNDGTSRLCLNA